ncbi:MAG: DUF2071 domain-containing protein [Candidatus Acidiferrales bacterium]
MKLRTRDSEGSDSPLGIDTGRGVFLTAEWRDLVMLNYEADPALLRDYVPAGVELDAFEGRTYVSLVGFRFLRTKLLGVFAVPFHTNFDEVNLRFYVRRREGAELRRGVVFIREFVPHFAIAGLARMAYGEKYDSCPMQHESVRTDTAISAAYGWQFEGQHFRLAAEAIGAPDYVAENSLENFITEHYWGYSAQADGASVEYRVSHERWRIWTAAKSGFEGEAQSLYGSGFGETLRRPANSAFIAEGSPVVVHKGRPITLR